MARFLSIFIFLLFGANATFNSVFADWTKAKSTNFSVNAADLHPGEIIFSQTYSDGHGLQNSWPSEIDGLGALEMQQGKILAVKASFLIKKNIKELASAKYAGPGAISSLLPDLKIIDTTPDGCIDVAAPTGAPFPIPGLPSNVTFTLALSRDLHPPSSSLDENLGQPALTMTQASFNFNMMFDTSTSYLRFYPLSESTTLVVAYETFHVRQSAIENAKKIPFLNLQGQVMNKIKSEVNGLVTKLNN